MKVIFLDFDGVLNVITQGHDDFGGIFHEHLVDNLRYIIEETGAKIVISSSWKSDGLFKLVDMWKSRNYPGEIIGTTPNKVEVINSGMCKLYVLVHRGHEIKLWLDIYQKNIENYVILDDDNDMLDSQKEHFVLTSGNSDHEDCVDIGYGLTRKCAEKAIEILNKNN